MPARDGRLGRDRYRAGCHWRAQRDATRKVFHAYLPRHFYLHRDLFRDAAINFLDAFGMPPDPAHHEARPFMRGWADATDFHSQMSVIRAISCHLRNPP